MHYKKAPPPKGAKALYLADRRCSVRCGRRWWHALRDYRQNNERLDRRRIPEVGRHSFPRNSRRAVLALKGSLRRAKKRRALDRCGPLGTPLRYEGMGFSGMAPAMES